MPLIRLFFIIITLILLVSCRTNVSTHVASEETVEPSVQAVPKSSRDLLLTRGALAPDFLLAGFNGETYRLSDQKGKGVVLNFWASWCGPCRWEMPYFEKNWKEYQENILFVGVAVRDFEEEARLFSELTGVSYPNGLDNNGEIAALYNVASMPTTYFIDKDGLIVRGLIGATNEGTLKWFIDNLFKNTEQQNGISES